MSLVIQGDFTLGQLIAFRIIAGNVTGPLLQLAGLYQGFQSVQLSMERLEILLIKILSLIVNQSTIKYLSLLLSEMSVLRTFL